MTALTSLQHDPNLVARLMDMSPIGIVMLDVGGAVTFANRRAEEILCLTRAQLSGTAYNAPVWRITSFDGTPFQDDELPFTKVRTTLQPVFDVRHAIEVAPGVRRFLSVNAAPLLDGSGRLEGVIATVNEVSAEVVAEKARERAEERVHLIVDAAPFGVHMYELGEGDRLVFTGANPAADRILGISHAALKGLTIDEAFPGLRGTPVPDQYTKIARGDGRFDEEQLVYDDGTIKGAFQVIAFNTGRRRMTVFFHDISVRKRAEAENTLLAQTVKSVQDCITITDLEDRLIFVNDAFCRTYGYEEDDVLGKEITILRSPSSDQFHPRQILSATLEGGWHGEMVNRKKDGTEFPVEVWTSAVRDRAGAVIAAVGVARDITERKHDEALLQERDMWLRKTQSVAKVGSYNLDIPADRWTSSEILDEIFGIGPGTPKTVETWNLLVHPDEREEMLRYFLNDVVGAKRPFNKEYRIVRKSTGEVRWVWGQGELTYDAAGNPVQMFGTIQDITERAVAQEQIRTSLREKEMLLKEIHHRVKNNMQVVTSLLNLESEKAADPGTRALFKESMTRIRSMALVHEKLYRSPSLSSIDFGEYLNSVSNELMRTYHTPGVACIVDAEAIPLGIDIAIPCGLIVSELVSNALKHAFAGRQQGNLRVILRRQDPAAVMLKVLDDGVGFPAGVDFRNAASMGLNLVVSLATQIRGSVVMERDSGTVFTVTFPA